MTSQEPRSFFQKVKGILFKKRTLAVVFVITLILGAVVYFQIRGGESQYLLESARYTSITERVSETGNVTTAGVIPAYSTTTGIVEEVLVSNGDVVEKDAKLFSVKSTANKQQKDSALASYLAAKSALDSAKATELSLQSSMFSKWDRYKDLAESDTYTDYKDAPREVERNVAEFHVPEKDWLSAEAAYKNQQQVVQEKSVALSSAWQAYQSTQDSTVVAVLGGEVRNLAITRGDAVIAPTASTLSSTKPALVVIDTQVRTTIEFQVNETDVLKVQEGQKAIVEFDAIDGQDFTGVVDRVDTVATGTQDIVQFSVYVVLDEILERVQPGMTADVDIIVASKDNVLTVPSSAVKPYQGGRAVRVVGSDGEVVFVPVEVGARGDRRTEILSGISEGTEVIVSLANEQIERNASFF